MSARGSTEIRCNPCLVSCHEVGTDVELLLADIGEVFRCPPVVRFAAADVARLDVDGCLLCHRLVCILGFTSGY